MGTTLYLKLKNKRLQCLIHSENLHNKIKITLHPTIYIHLFKKNFTAPKKWTYFKFLDGSHVEIFTSSSLTHRMGFSSDIRNYNDN